MKGKKKGIRVSTPPKGYGWRGGGRGKVLKGCPELHYRGKECTTISTREGAPVGVTTRSIEEAVRTQGAPTCLRKTSGERAGLKGGTRGGEGKRCAEGGEGGMGGGENGGGKHLKNVFGTLKCDVHERERGKRNPTG